MGSGKRFSTDGDGNRDVGNRETPPEERNFYSLSIPELRLAPEELTLGCDRAEAERITPLELDHGIDCGAKTNRKPR